nr:unnamed protein product [Callosobruchus chinensis]
MDISVFSSEEFDTKAWVNEIMKNPEHQNDSNYTMSLVTKLQLYVQQLNSTLEETSQQVLSSLPKIMRDTSSLQQEAVTLKQKMATVKSEIERIEYDTGKSIDTIEKLDSLMNRLNMAKQGLHESDNWTVLVNDLEEVFDTKNIDAISSKIVSMQNSLKLLVNISDYEDRKLQLEGLKNRLEAIASPSVVQAFNTNNLEQSQLYMKIFASIGRMPQLIKYYHKCQKDVLLKKWRDQLEIEQDYSTIEWIHNYYSTLLSNWHQQCRWCSQVFPTNVSSAKTLLEVYVDVLTSLDPSLKECCDAALKQVPDKLNFLIEVKENAKHFADSLLKVIDQSQDKVPKESIRHLEKAIYAHLVPYVSKYSSYEESALLKRLSQLNLKKEPPANEWVQSLSLSIPQVMDIAREAKKDCLQLTEGCGYAGLLIALRGFFREYAAVFEAALRQIETEHDNRKQQEDWSTFQICFYLLQNVGEVLLKIQELEKDLTESILELNQRKVGSDVVDFKHLLLKDADLKEYESLVKCVTEGTQLSLLDHVTSEFSKLCSSIHHTTYQVVFFPIASVLDVVQSPDTWAQFTASHNADLPDYSFTPQEYITQIGQYLMTLPQHLEPFLFKENPSLACALKATDHEYDVVSENNESSLAHTFLAIVARGVCQSFTDKILSICQLSQPASRQLAHDINYFNNILEELGVPLTESLQQLSMLLRIPSEQYQGQSQGCSARLVAAVRQMRNIKSGTS